jgi:hypothetical protein
VARARKSNGRTPSRRGRTVLVVLLVVASAGVAAITGYRQRQLAKNRAEFEKVYG